MWGAREVPPALSGDVLRSTNVGAEEVTLAPKQALLLLPLRDVEAEAQGGEEGWRQETTQRQDLHPVPFWLFHFTLLQEEDTDLGSGLDHMKRAKLLFSALPLIRII